MASVTRRVSSGCVTSSFKDHLIVLLRDHVVWIEGAIGHSALDNFHKGIVALHLIERFNLCLFAVSHVGTPPLFPEGTLYLKQRS